MHTGGGGRGNGLTTNNLGIGGQIPTATTHQVSNYLALKVMDNPLPNFVSVIIIYISCVSNERRFPLLNKVPV